MNLPNCKYMALTVISALLFIPAVAHAKVERSPLKHLVANSDAILLVTVNNVYPMTDDPERATARVLEVWKGQDRETIEFSVAKTWTCDISTATKGETIVLFLSSQKKSPFMQIAFSGRGRMPTRKVQGKLYADICSDVILPDGMKTIPGPNPDSSWIRSVKLSVLKKEVLSIIKKSKNEEEY